MSEKASAKTALVNLQSPIAGRCRAIALVSTVSLMVFFPLPVIFWLVIPNMEPLIAAALITASIASLLFFWLATNTYKMNRSGHLVISDLGITMPHGRLTNPLAKNFIPWADVEKLSVEKETWQSDEERELVITAKNRSSVRVKLSLMSAVDLDKFVSACELWANRWTRDSSFVELVQTVTDKRVGDGDCSFTALWMQEAHRRMSATPFVPLAPGASLQDGRVKVVQMTTSGGWSAIYLCQWQEKTPAVLKEAVVPPGASEDLKAKAFEQFEREAVLLSGLNHPQIAKVLDYFVENNRQYMVLQRISGANLRSYVLDRGPVSEKQAIKWIRELVDVISYLHGRDPAIVHRDITPENLVLDMKGSLVLIDFGSANEFVGTVTGTLVGKPSYVAPEQFSGHANLQSDLYSLGAVIHYMLTGQDPQPLAVASPKAVQPIVNEDLDRLVADLMCLNVKERIKNIEDVRQRLTSLAVV